METSIAVIGLPAATRGHADLATAFAAAGLSVIACPATEPRAMLRWTMDLSPDQTAACIFLDHDGNLTASLVTALDPDIPAINWCPSPVQPERLVQLLSGTAVLVSFAANATVLVQTLRSLRLTMGTETAPSPASADMPLPVADILTLPAAYQPPGAPPVPQQPTEPEENDAAIYEQLESMMAISHHTPLPARQPVVIQTPGLDFSLPLRQLMSAARALAQQCAEPEVQGIHYIAAVDEPYASAFTKAGLDLESLRQRLAGSPPPSGPATEPIISDDVFDAVNSAKTRARQVEAPAIRVADFLMGLLNEPAPALESELAAAGVSPAQLLSALTAIDPSAEPTSEPFFKPSSLDQAGFYQFDSSQVQDVAERLMHLPAYKKAAARVAEARPKGPASSDPAFPSGAAASPSQPSAPPVPEPAPEQPEIFKVTGEFPAVDVVEQVSDLLLEGQIVAFPSDIMFALAVDAANPAAIANLREVAALDADKPLSILINSTSQLKHLVKADVDALEPLLEELWPGPLTLVFNSMSGAGRHVAWNKTIAIRQPSDNVSLAILSMLGRPLAVTSWDNDPADLHGSVAAILETPSAPEPTRTTIADLSREPWNIIRPGAVPAEDVLRFQP